MYTIRILGGAKLRNKLKQELADKGINTTIYFTPVHSYTVFKKKGFAKTHLPITTEVSNQVLSLPIFPQISQDELGYIVNAVGDFFEGY